MTEPKFIHSIALNQAQERQVEQLKAKKIGITEIFKQGLELCYYAEFKAPNPPKSLTAKAKGLIARI